MEALVLIAVVLVAVVLLGRHKASTESGSPPPPAVQEPEPEPSRDYGELVRLAGWSRVGVVGESHYQPALRACVDGRASQGYADAPRVRAVLVPEPDNPHDHHAVRVDVDRRTVGYLPRGSAGDYQRVLQRLRGRTGWCVGRVTGGGERSYGIYLHLAPPDAVVPVNAPGNLALLEGDHHVTVTKLDQDAVAPFTQGVLLPASVFVSLVPTPVERGKYAGQTTFAVHVDGRRIGEVTRRMAERYEPLVAEVAGAGVAGCEAVITRGDKGFEVSLMLPEVEE